MNTFTAKVLDDVYSRLGAVDKLLPQVKAIEKQLGIADQRLNNGSKPVRGPRGLYVPFYIYPSNPSTNSDIALLTDASRKLRGTASVVAIINPSSGPGTTVDSNYKEAIRILDGAGVFCMGYVPTNQGNRPSYDVRADVDRWNTLYTEIDGIFFDQVPSTFTTDLVTKYTDFYKYVKSIWIDAYIDINPGVPVPTLLQYQGTFFDIVVAWESNAYPTQQDALGNQAQYYDPRFRCAMVHSQSTFSSTKFDTLTDWYGFVYVSDDTNPWSIVSSYWKRMVLLISTVEMSTSAAVYNVKDYGALGDGSTNDQGAFTDAITAMPAAGGILYVPPGTYIVSNVLLNKPGIIFEGTGSASIIKQQATTSGTTVRTVEVSADDIVVRNMSIDGNAANVASGTTAHGLTIQPTSRAHVYDVHIHDCAKRGIDLLTPQEAVVERCVIDSTGDHGIIISGTSTASASKNTFRGCVINSATNSGIHISSTQVFRTCVDGCSSYSCTEGFTVNCNDNKLYGCHAENCQSHGYALTSNNIKVVNCTGYANGQNGTSAGTGDFYVAGDDAQLTACESRNFQGSGFYTGGTNKGEMSLTHCHAENCGSSGFDIENTSNTRLDSCHAQNCSDAGYYIAAGLTTLMNCVSYNNAASFTGDFVVVASINFITIIGCSSQYPSSSNVDSFSIKSNDTILSGNMAIGSTLRGIVMTGSRCSVTSNYIDQCPGSGIEIESSASHVLVTNNVVFSTNTDITSNGTNVLVTNNMRV